MSLSPGTHLGPYEITAQIGIGGMGEVYRATDTNLKRSVAIKVLPAAVAGDAERLARFQREAELLASLNHPHIAAIYGLERSGATTALVMELVEGPTLADRIAQGPIPLDEALPIAKQIAEALEAAHEQGIIHRDLKPANIKVRPDGTVKVLDFGLAKAMEPADAASASASMSPTLSLHATQAGVILGTAAYMSPEQARGKAVDRRADIWAFGAVLFEMLTGTRAFPGEDITDTLAAVVRADPEWSLVPPAISPTLLLFLRRSLQKDPKQRVGDIRDLRLAIEGAFEVPSAPATPVVAPIASRRRERVAWAAALGVVSLAALALAAVTYVRPAPADLRPARFFVSPPDGWRVMNVMGSGIPAGSLTVSPDGSRFAFLASAATTARGRLWVRAIDTLTAQELPGTDGAVAPFWSPDSRFLAFFADGKLKRIAVSGGPAVPLCDVGAIPTGGTWSQDGVIVFGPNNTSALQRVSASGGVPAAATVLGKGETFHLRPSFLPDGRHFIYRVGNGGLDVGSLDSTARTLLTEDPVSANVFYSRGHLLFLRDTTLMAQPFDLGQLTLSGEPVPIADQVQRINTAPADGIFSASDAGVLVYQTGTVGSSDRQLTWFDRAGKVLGLVERPGQYNTVALSPDGMRVVVSRDDTQAAGRGTGQTGNTDLWVHEFARSTSTRLTFDPARDWMAAWSPDGSRIVWSSTRDGNNDNLYQKVANGAGPDEALFKSSDTKFLYDWSLDGRFLLYAVGLSGKRQLWALPLTGDNRKPTPYLQTDFDTVQARFSPDGRFVAYASNASGKSEVYVQPFPVAASGEWIVSQGGGAQPRWRRDGKELFYISADSKVMAVPVSTTPAFAPGVPKTLFTAPIWGGGATVNVTRYDVTADGQKFLMTVLPPEAATAPPAPITVVLNWTAGIKQ